MPSGSLKAQRVVGDFVNQNPIRFNVAVSPAFPVSAKGVILLLRREGVSAGKDFDDSPKFFEVFTSFLKDFDVLPEFGGDIDLHLKEAIKSSALSKCSRSCPFPDFLKEAAVSAFGVWGLRVEMLMGKSSQMMIW